MGCRIGPSGLLFLFLNALLPFLPIFPSPCSLSAVSRHGKENWEKSGGQAGPNGETGGQTGAKRGNKYNKKKEKRRYIYIYLLQKKKTKRGILVQDGGLSPSPPPSDLTAPKVKPVKMETEMIVRAI